MRIGFIVEPRYMRQEMPWGAIRALRRRHASVDIIRPFECRFDPVRGVARVNGTLSFHMNRYELVVSRNRNALGLAMLAYADAVGIPTINSHVATQRVRNKAEMATVLGPAGVPCAPTMLADDVDALAALPPDWFPLILKATYGDNSQGLRLVRRPDDLREMHWGDDVVLAQHYVPNDGYDLKLYVCGRRVAAVRKPSPLNGDPKAATCPVRLDSELAALALRCGDAFGLEVYGVDAIETPDGPLVIEVNDFPNFTGVSGAADWLADYILERARNAERKEAGEDRVPAPATAA
jgi:ribosomal protein S6--L-glutamate ligase